MLLKMNDLVKKTKVSKSTILYYIKEGILPKPLKEKANLHLYDQNTITMLEFIRYLQIYFNISISQIKQITAKENFKFENCFKFLFESTEILLEPDKGKRWTKEELCEEFKLENNELEMFINEGILFQKDGFFTQKEYEILNILKEGKENGIGFLILFEYIKKAKELSLLEAKLKNEILSKTKNKNKASKSIFDFILILKPYVLNMHTFKAFKEDV